MKDYSIKELCEVVDAALANMMELSRQRALSALEITLIQECQRLCTCKFRKIYKDNSIPTLRRGQGGG